jgi:hypothetical protein
MISHEQARTALIYGFQAQLQAAIEKEVQAEAYGERVKKAATLALSGAVSQMNTEVYLVQGSAPEPYQVNGACQCIDYRRYCEGKTECAPKGICKHRLAVWLVRKTEAHMAKTAHSHLYTCGHAQGRVLCYAEPCEEKDLRCEACYARAGQDAQVMATPEPEEELVDVTRETQLQEVEEEEEREELAETEEEAPCPLNYTAASEAGMYERYVPEPVLEPQEPEGWGPLPEAPTSVYLKLRLPGGHELSWTMRSMREGGAGDQEILARMPVVLEGLQKLAERSQTKGRWLARLSTLFAWTRED